MEYKRFNNTIVARIDKDEEIVTKLHNIAIKENKRINPFIQTNPKTFYDKLQRTGSCEHP